MKKNETMEKLKELLLENGYYPSKEMSGMGGRDSELEVWNCQFYKGYENVYIYFSNYDIADKYTKKKS